MPPADDVTETDVLSMFDKDGDLRDEPQGADEESADEGEEATEEGEGEETDAEEETEEEGEDDSKAEEDEESDEAEEEEPESKVDWSKASPEHKAAHEADQKEIGKLRKDYGKLHSKYAEVSQSRREEDQTLQELRADAQTASQWNAILEQHPELQDQIIGLIEKAQNPDTEIPEHLKDDPAIQFFVEQNRRLQNQVRQLSEQTQPLNEWQNERQTAANRQVIEGILGEGAQKFKAMFKRDITEDEKTAVLRYIVQNKYYGTKDSRKGVGANAVLDVFGAQYEKALSAKRGSDLKAKANKFGGRNKSVNSRQATSAPKINSSNDAIKQALADQGLEV